MVKIRVRIFSWSDSSVSVFINLPSVPRVGESVYLTEDQLEYLENIIKEKGLHESYSKWFFGKSCGKKKKVNLRDEDLSLSDCAIVNSVFYRGDEDFVNIELNDEEDIENED